MYIYMFIYMIYIYIYCEFSVDGINFVIMFCGRFIEIRGLGQAKL